MIDIDDIVFIAKKAGEAIREIYKGDIEVEIKEDSSPLTKADKAANDVIVQELVLNYPDIPILSEEGKSIPYEERKGWGLFWLIDPLDGTKEFIKKNGEFTVNIALISDGVPVLGVVYAPILNLCYYAKSGEGAYKDGVRLPSAKSDVFTVVASKSHNNEETEKFIESMKKEYPNLQTKFIGSSLKLCLVAEGVADIYPRVAPTMEWDTAAAHAIVRESGKKVVDFSTREELSYNKENLLNPSFLVY